jgi:hypothetical protein
MGDPNDLYTATRPSPSGAYAIRIASNEMKMSHWVDSAVLVDASGKPLLDFGSLWSADSIEWLDDARVELKMRHYPGDRSVVLLVDAASRVVTVNGVPARTWSFEETARWMKNPR